MRLARWNAIPCNGATREESRILENSPYGLRQGTEIVKSLPTLFCTSSINIQYLKINDVVEGAVLYDHCAVLEQDLVVESLILPWNSIEGRVNR